MTAPEPQAHHREAAAVKARQQLRRQGYQVGDVAYDARQGRFVFDVAGVADADRCTVSLEEDRGGVRGGEIFWTPCALEAGHAGDHRARGGKRWPQD